MQGKIFISYRRNDGAANARSVRDRLARVFGDNNVFMDVDNLLAGKRFDKELKNAIAQTTVFLAVIGPRWMALLKERQASGERDYVHEEVAAALARELLVIPVLIEGGTLPRQNELPEDVRDLALHQKHEISHEHFGRGCRRFDFGHQRRSVPARLGRNFTAVCRGVPALYLRGCAGGVVLLHQPRFCTFDVVAGGNQEIHGVGCRTEAGAACSSGSRGQIGSSEQERRVAAAGGSRRAAGKA